MDKVLKVPKRADISQKVLLSASPKTRSLSPESPPPIFNARITTIQQSLHAEVRENQNPTEKFIKRVYTKHGLHTFKIMQLIAKCFNKDSCIHYHTAGRCFEITNSTNVLPSQLRQAFDKFFYTQYAPHIEIARSLKDNICITLAPIQETIISGSDTVSIITQESVQKTVREVINNSSSI